MSKRRLMTETVFRAVDRFSRPVAKMHGRMQRFNRRGKKGMDRLKEAALRAGRAFRTAVLGVTAMGAAAAFGAYRFLKAGADFEQAITNVGAVTGSTRLQIQALEERAKQLGSTTKFTATQAANAMEILARAGFSQNEILAATPGVLDAAAASGLEMAEVANVVSNALKGMGLEASQAGRVADVLALASARTNSTIGSLGESLKNVASTARQLNVPLEETVAAVALLQDVGLDASVAGSAMNTMLTKLAKPTKALQQQMRKMGITLHDAQGNMLPLPELLNNFSRAAQRSGGNLEVVAFFADLVGLRGQKAATNLKDLFESGRFSELATQLDSASGSAKEMAEIRMDTLTGDITKLNSLVESIRIDIFNNANSELREIVQNTANWIRENKNLIVAMGSDPFGWYREAVYVVEDVLLGLERTTVRVINALLKYNPVALAQALHGVEPEQLPMPPSQAEVEAQRQSEMAGFSPQVVPPQERVSREIRESRAEGHLRISLPEGAAGSFEGSAPPNMSIDIPMSGAY